MKIFDPQLTGSIEVKNPISGSVTTLGNVIALGSDSSLTGSFTGSFKGDGSALVGVIVDSGSWDGIFTGSAAISGSLNISGAEAIQLTVEKRIRGQYYSVYNSTAATYAGYLITSGDFEDDATTDLGLASGTGRNIRFYTANNPVEKMRLTTDGNLGIGTTSPSRNLSIVSTTDTSVEIKSGNANQSSLFFSDVDDGNIGGVLYTHNDNAMAFRVNDSTKLTISSGGDVTLSGNGTTSALLFGQSSYARIINTSGQTLYVDSDVHEFRTNGGVAKLTISSGGAATLTASYSGGTFPFRVGYLDGSSVYTPTFVINDNGNVGIGSTGIYAGSNAILNLQGSGIALKNDRNGSNNNWSYIQNTGTSSNSDINFYTGNNSSALNLSHSGDAQFTSVKGSGESLNVKILDSNTNYAQGTGGGLLFQGIFQNNGNIAGGGAIQISKVNSTNGDYSYDMDFYTRPLGSALAKRLTITSTGAIAVGSSSTNYGSSGQVLTSNGNASPSWTTGSGAKGEPGGTGAQGTAGSNGSNGAQGTAGTNGSNGALGSQGTNGSTGAQGAVGLNGGTGSQGATGATGGGGGTGAQGTAGSNGGTGAQGTTGTTGGDGGTGAQGATGTTGGSGGTGAQGTAGSNGSNGNNGAQGTTGTTGNTGSTGSNGSNGGTGAQGTSGAATFPYSGTAVFSNQIQLSNSDGYLYGGSISTRSGSRAIHLGYSGSCIAQWERTGSSTSAILIASSVNFTALYSRVSGSSTSGRTFSIYMGNTERFQMNTSGVMTGDFNDVSDILLKKNIEFHGYGLVAINSLKPREFNWKESTRPQGKQVGFIAQEVEEIIPEVIHGYDGKKSINATGLISVLTKAIQELSQEVTNLKTEVELLKQQ